MHFGAWLSYPVFEDLSKVKFKLFVYNHVRHLDLVVLSHTYRTP